MTMLLLAALLIATGNARIAIEDAHPRAVVLHDKVIDTRSHPEFHQEPHPSSRFQGLSIGERLDHPKPFAFLVHVDRDAIDDSTLSNLQGKYIPHNTFVALGTHADALALQQTPGVLWVGNLPIDTKISPTITQPPAPDDPFLEPVVPLPTGAKFTSGSSALKGNSVSGADNATADFSLVVELAPVIALATGRDQAATIASTLQAKLTSLLAYPVPVTVIRADRLLVVVRAEPDLQAASLVIADDPQVLFVERRLAPKKLNRWARGILQDGLVQSANYASRTGLLSWDHNLLGDGQIIGVADSGIDTKHCFFADAYRPVPFVPYTGAATASSTSSSSNLLARKIVQYVTYADASDDAEGHGTHVAGTIGGSPPTPGTTYDPYVGMAPNSKIAFFDIGHSDGTLTIPDDLTSPFLGWAYVAGARIHSNSWGVSTPYYTANARDFDLFMYEHKDMVVVVAAGNDGSCDGQTTVNSPSSAKNVVSVGATMTNADNYAYTGLQPPYYASDPGLFTSNNLAMFSSRGPTPDLRIKPDIVAPGFNTISARTPGQNACGQPLSSVLTSKSGTSMATPAVAGHLALIRQYFVDGYYPTGTKTPSNALSPSGSLVKAVAIAGAVALTGGRLIDDTMVSRTPKCPNPAYASVAHVPGIDQGWGRLELSTVLPFAPAATFGMLLLGTDRRNAATFGDISIRNRQTHTYRLCAMPSKAAPAIKIALVWTDPPAQPVSGIQLVNNLDLQVTFQNAVHWGNAGAYVSVGPDVRNPVEVVTLSAPATSPADLQVTVIASGINVGASQPYSLVVTGFVFPSSCATTKDIGNVTLSAMMDGAAPGLKPVVHGDPSDRPASFLLLVLAFLAAVITLIAVVAVISARFARTRKRQPPPAVQHTVAQAPAQTI
ncbi:subtilisin [Plasmodiophora brassicae]|uniref:subtilisin n=2 Tax=Plasmodiophora brassicae TaxID=37360 RepID=A0A3P3Y632_PLABS|nr:unnamed protein product [Plasmodiophora brassicae]